LQLPDNFCKQILELDKTIRFVGIADISTELVMSEYREGVTPLLPGKESEMSLFQSVMRMESREGEEEKLGKTIYSFTVFEKVKRATIPLHDNYKLMVSFDTSADHESIISKILQICKKQGLK